MKKRTVTRWAARQYSGSVKPFPLWLRGLLIAGALAVVIGKLAGWF